MMKCSEFEKLVDDYLDESLNPLQHNACRIHSQSCQQCNEKLRSLEDLLSQLNSLPPINMDSKFQRSLQVQYKPKHNYRILSGGLLAASVMLILVLNYFAEDTVSIPLNQAHQVKLLFESENNLNNVLFSIEVPQHMEISGYADRQLQWKGKLKKGENILTVPVLGKMQKPGYLIMRIQHNGKFKTLKVKLNPSADWS